MNFDKARVVLVDPTSSYLELDASQANAEAGLKCIYCQKTNAHEHDIIGKVKFQPSQKIYLVSLVEKKMPLALFNKTKRKGLEILPIQTSPKENRIPDKNPKKATEVLANATKGGRHVYPVTVPNEKEGKKSKQFV